MNGVEEELVAQLKTEGRIEELVGKKTEIEIEIQMEAEREINCRCNVEIKMERRR